MNKQGKVRGNKVVGGIEWTKTIHENGKETQGFTWNPIAGCKHGCRWTMPDGSEAICYAEEVANGVAQKAYPQGFEHHYVHPRRLDEPLQVKTPSKIFLDSMSDLMGNWVSDEDILAVFDVCRRAHWHTFQLLTKNAPRLAKFKNVIPYNVWVGVSAPPSKMLGHTLSFDQQKRMVKRQLDALSQLNVNVRWMSVEPLSFDIAPLLDNAPLEWVVIGAATNGRKTYQPNAEWVQNLLDTMDEQSIPVFFKGNLQWSPWREHFPSMPVKDVKHVWVDVLTVEGASRVEVSGEADSMQFEIDVLDTIPDGRIAFRVIDQATGELLQDTGYEKAYAEWKHPVLNDDFINTMQPSHEVIDDA